MAYSSMIKTLGVLCVSASMLTACQTSGSTFSKENVGGLLGAAGGAVAGAQFGKGTGKYAAIAGGTLLGAFLGSQIGSSLDRADQMYANQTAQRTFEYAPTGQAQTWRNPDSGNFGTVTPTRTYQSANTTCREYTQTINVGGRKETAVGTACRQPDGSWVIQ